MLAKTTYLDNYRIRISENALCSQNYVQENLIKR